MNDADGPVSDRRQTAPDVSGRRSWSRILVSVLVVEACTLLILWLLQALYG